MVKSGWPFAGSVSALSQTPTVEPVVRLTFGSVCSGIEAASVAWAPLGWVGVWFSEIKPFPCSVLAHHYPDVPNLGDMTTVAARIRQGQVAAPDVLAGGTPCQAFSTRGQRASLADARGSLSLTFCDIADAIDEVRHAKNTPPCIVFWENVTGILSLPDNAFGCFLAELAGEDRPLEPAGGRWSNAGAVFGPRRAVAWRVLDAQHFGVPQRRRRVFVVATADTATDPVSILFEFGGCRRDAAPLRAMADAIAPPTAPCVGVRQPAIIPDQTVIAFSRDDLDDVGGYVCPTLRLSNRVALARFYQPDKWEVRLFTPVECERLQGFPDGYTAVPFRNRAVASDTARYEALGNSWAVPVVRWLGERIQAGIQPY